jgi:hypothetical protein
MNILITDQSSFSTVIGCGSRPPGPINSAIQINGWTTKNQVFGPGRGSTQAVPPFSRTGGDCLYDTQSLFCFEGPMNAQTDNVLMVLWGFNLSPQAGHKGEGRLNNPSSAGNLAEGSISWEVL